MITLFQFHRACGLPNVSPFCMKLETYLRMANIPYQNKFVNNPQRSPKRKLPCIKFEEKLYPDSEFIIDELKARFGNELDKGLTTEQRAMADLINIAFCERLYWVVVYLRWQDDAGWNLIKKTMFGKLPVFLQLFIPDMIRKKMLKMLDFQGMGRHSLEEVMMLGIKSLDHFSTILGENNYFLGNKPCSVDATAFAFLANIIGSPFENQLKHHALKKHNLLAYCNRMWDDYYPDFVKPQELVACISVA